MMNLQEQAPVRQNVSPDTEIELMGLAFSKTKAAGLIP